MVYRFNNLFALSALSLGELIFEVALFLGLVLIGMALIKIIPTKTDNKFLNPTEYLPEDELHTLRQVSFLALMAACFIIVLYSLIYVGDDIFYFALFDCILSLYIAISIDKSTNSHKFLVLLLVPYGSLTYLLFNNSLVGILDLIHIPIFIYFIKYYYDKFKEYTESNGLGITIILLFSIIFCSFIFTSAIENKNLLDSLVMVSNAFTSNGYAVLGTTVGGKINSLILVWAGFVISGVGTATLTAAILTRHFNRKFEQLEKLIKNNED